MLEARRTSRRMFATPFQSTGSLRRGCMQLQAWSSGSSASRTITRSSPRLDRLNDKRLLFERTLHAHAVQAPGPGSGCGDVQPLKTQEDRGRDSNPPVDTVVCFSRSLPCDSSLSEPGARSRTEDSARCNQWDRDDAGASHADVSPAASARLLHASKTTIADS